METGLFIIRVLVGLTLAAHGAQKLFGWFGGYGIAGTGGFFESIGFKPGKVFAAMAGLGETGGGLGLALGLLTPLSAAVIISTMLVAIVSVHLPKGFWGSNGGYEFNLILIAIAAGLAFTGPGALSVDAAAGLPLAGPAWGILALVLGVLGTIPALAARATARQATATPSAAH
jgi:putative oxidoreductase